MGEKNNPEQSNPLFISSFVQKCSATAQKKKAEQHEQLTSTKILVGKFRKSGEISFNFVAISTLMRSNFSTNAGMCDIQLSFGKANLT